MDDWTFKLADSATMTPIAELVGARGRTLELGLNQPGSCSMNMHMDDTGAADVAPVTTCIIAYRNGSIKWSGPVWHLDEDMVSNTMEIRAVGWFEILNHRVLKTRKIYASQDAGLIAFDLLATANAEGATRVVEGTRVASANRAVTFEAYHPIGRAIHDLSQVENGYDWWVNPSTRALNIYSLLQTDRTNVVMGLGEGAGGQASIGSAKRSIDASSLANRFIAIGQGATAQSDDATSQSTYGIYEDTAQLGEHGSSVLLAYSGVEVLLRKDPWVSYEITPRPADPDGIVPVPFVDYEVGDKVYISIDRGRVNVQKQAVRVFGLTLSIDDNGGERVTGLRLGAS